MSHQPTERVEPPAPREPMSLGYRIFIGCGLGLLGLVLLADYSLHHHAPFEQARMSLGTSLWFYPLYGLIGTLGVVIFAKTVAIALKRKDTFYADH